ncbi:hypothetical protein FZC76_22085 [Sutcliffiella horikoshii]|uniref:Uncharacterized protein n=1 Tax=Sutcliffiella horikoshii TaxID=79883 RepID=A0A5D4S760_9BACI|nr:hypothetical protein [Sutcliffiella horikoshii]TYS59523.1 hypothetical protein FZC76_22085 [Sutcliffiella horikoshii]
MPSKFSPTTPVEYVPFDFGGYFDSMKEYFGEYTFFEKWKRYWMEIFHEQDEKLKRYIKMFPNTNPIMQRAAQHPSLMLKDYEMFQVDHITDYGTYCFHFDVEAMHTIKDAQQVPVDVIRRSDIYIDPDTPHIKEKLEDERLPYFVRMAGIKDSFICADGNKRVRARIERGDKDFKGYTFWPEHAERIFFSPMDFYFYIFLYEVNAMYNKMMENPHEENILSVTQMHLQANAAK